MPIQNMICHRHRRRRRTKVSLPSSPMRTPIVGLALSSQGRHPAHRP